MLNSFDQWLEAKYLNKKARKDRWAWNVGIRQRRPIANREDRQWKPAVAYCRYADDFVVLVKGTKSQARVVREQCRQFLEGELKLTLNMEKSHVTHINDGFVFLGHRVIGKRGPRGTRRVVTAIPKDSFKRFAATLIKELSGDYSTNKIDQAERLSRQLAGWATFYQFTDYTATVYSKLDSIVFWKFAHWLARKYRASIKSLMRKWVRCPTDGTAKTWVLSGLNGKGQYCGVSLRRLVSSRKGRFLWRTPDTNPYLFTDTLRGTFTSNYGDVVMAMSHC